MLDSEGNVIHEGMGEIYQVGEEGKAVYNSFLHLSCEKYPCVKEVNATLPYGG